MTKLYICSICGKSIINDVRGNCSFCGAHKSYILECNISKSEWRCTVCIQFFDELPDKCPVCGASSDKFVQQDGKETLNIIDSELSQSDIENVKKALEVEVSNSTFYFCAAAKSDKAYERELFQALGEVEFEHAVIWKSVLKLDNMPKSADECAASSLSNLKESHSREAIASKFYAEAAEKSVEPRLRMLFKALVEIENDHLDMSELRITAYAK